MEKKQSVLIVHNYYQIPGGEDTVVANEKKLLEDHGHKVVMYTRHNSELNEMSSGRKILSLLASFFNMRTYRDVRRIIREENIDIVHVHNTLTLISPSVYYAAVSRKVPVVQTIHNFRMLCPGAMFYRDGQICEDCLKNGLHCAVQHSCYRNSRLQTLAVVLQIKLHRMTGIYKKLNYICLTEFNREKLQQLRQIKPEQVYIKPNFVESTGKFIPGEERENQFVFAGRLDALKGIDVLLKIWSEIGKSAPKLIVCGTGPMEQWCRDFVKAHKCNVELKGYVPNSEVREITARSRALLLPTRWYEGFPVSIVEAYSVGTPVIVPDMGNCGSVVTHGKTGWKYRDIKELPEIISTAKHADLYESVFNTFNELYTESLNYKTLISIYSQLAAN